LPQVSAGLVHSFLCRSHNFVLLVVGYLEGERLLARFWALLTAASRGLVAGLMASVRDQIFLAKLARLVGSIGHAAIISQRSVSQASTILSHAADLLLAAPSLSK
jgi:hypothetical protein